MGGREPDRLGLLRCLSCREGGARWGPRGGGGRGNEEEEEEEEKDEEQEEEEEEAAEKEHEDARWG